MKDKTSTVLQPPRPAADFSREQELLPMFLLEQIADNHPTEVLGDMVGRGRLIPVLDVQGDTNAYWFPFITGSRQFPGEENIFGQLRVLREKMTATGMSPESLAEWDHFTNRFGTVLVVATHRDFPVLMVTYYLHPYFTTREELLAFARQSLGWGEVGVGKILFVNAHEEYLEIFSGDERLFGPPQPWIKVGGPAAYLFGRGKGVLQPIPLPAICSSSTACPSAGPRWAAPAKPSPSTSKAGSTASLPMPRACGGTAVRMPIHKNGKWSGAGGQVDESGARQKSLRLIYCKQGNNGC